MNKIAKLAEALGYEFELNESGIPYFLARQGWKILFEPANNPAQALEVLAWAINQDVPKGQEVTVQQIMNGAVSHALAMIEE